MSYVAYNATTKITKQLSKATERLSSGLRINSAADDAAGLAISEKMTAQIRGLDQASKNAQDGMSLLQTAEGALNEIHSMLQRMRELSVQAANGTLTSEDRGSIQLEVNELIQQITDIANQTQFNKKKLLNGDSAVLWSTSMSDISVLVGGTLLKKDIFGQRQNVEGNYKITFETVQAGSEQVQKSNIFYLKHGTQDTNSSENKASGIKGFNALNMVEGVWRVETLDSPFGGVYYYQGRTDSTPGEVGATLDTSGISDLAPGEYAIQLSDNVPMMATFDTGEVEDIYQSSRSALDTFDAAFEASAASNPSSATTPMKEDIASSGLLGTIDTVDDTDMNVYTYYEVTGTDARDLVGGMLAVSGDYSAPVGSTMDVTLDYKTDDTSNVSATINYAAADNKLHVRTSFHFTPGNDKITFTYNGKTEVYTITGSTIEEAASFLNTQVNADFGLTGSNQIFIGSVEYGSSSPTPGRNDLEATLSIQNLTGTGLAVEISGSAVNFLGMPDITQTTGTGNPVTSDTQVIGISNNYTAVGTKRYDLRMDRVVTITPGGGNDLQEIADRLNALLNSASSPGSVDRGIHVTVEETSPGSGVKHLQFNRISSNPDYSVDFSSGIFAHNGTLGSLADDLGLSSWKMDYDINSKDSGSVIDGYTTPSLSPLDTANMDMPTLASALGVFINGIIGGSDVTISNVQSSNPSPPVSTIQKLFFDNGSKYDITITGGNSGTGTNAIGDLHGSSAITLARGANTLSSGAVYVGHTFSIPVSGNYNGIVTDINAYLSTLPTGYPNTTGVSFITNGSGTSQTIRMQNASIYDLSIGGSIVTDTWPSSMPVDTFRGRGDLTTSDSKTFQSVGGVSAFYIDLGTAKTLEDALAIINDTGAAHAGDLTNSGLKVSITTDGPYRQLVFTNTKTGSSITVEQTSIIGEALLSSAINVVDGTPVNSNSIQTKDALNLLVAWTGNRADGTEIGPGSTTVRVYEGYDNAGLLNTGLGGTPLAGLYQNFVLNDPTQVPNFQTGDSWMMFTNAKASGDALKVNLTDDQSRNGLGIESQSVTYYFNDGVLDASTISNVNQMAWAGGGRKGKYENLQHHVDIADNAITSSPISFSYGERAGSGDFDEWSMGGPRAGTPYYAQAYYGEDTTYHIANGTDIGNIVQRVVVNKMNEINASLLFTWNGTQLTVESEGYKRDGSSANAALSPVAAGSVDGGPANIAGIDFTDIYIDTSGLSAGDKFVINVAAAAKLDNMATALSGFESNENISIYADLARSGGTGYGSKSQYRFIDGATPSVNYEGFIIDKPTGAVKSGTLSLTKGTLNSASGVGAPGDAQASGDTEAFWIKAQVNNQGSPVPGAGGLVTSVYIQDLETSGKRVVDYIPEVKYAEVKGQLGATIADSGRHNDYNASVIFDFLGFVGSKARFRIQAHVMDIEGNYAYVEDEERDLVIGQNAAGSQFVIFSAAAGSPAYTWQGTLPNFTGLYFDSFKLGDTWTAGDRFTLSLVASGAAKLNADSAGADNTMDEVTFMSDLLGTAQPHSFRFSDGALDNKETDFRIYQLANNTYIDEDSAHFADDQVMDGTVSLNMGELNSASDAVSFTSKFMKGIDAGVAHYYSRTEDIKQFWNANGAYMFESGPEKLSVKLGDRETDVYIYGGVELGKLARRMSEQIWMSLIQGHGEITGKSIDKNDIDDRDKDEIVQFVNSVPGQSTNEAVHGTMLAHSVIPGAKYELEFFGSEDIMKAFAFREIASAEDTVFQVTVRDAHSGKQIGNATKVAAGQNINNVVAPGISLSTDAAIGIKEVKYADAEGLFQTNLSAGTTIERFIHLADNALILQIGANQGEDTMLVLGDVTAKALGIQNLEVRNQESAARSVTRIDGAIKKISVQRAIIGSQINRLEHAVNAVTVASTNLSGARSKIKDINFAKEMMDFTKLNILQQAGMLMQAQANQANGNVLALIR
jgi:flagellin-like hook-associated protein FlgL